MSALNACAKIKDISAKAEDDIWDGHLSPLCDLIEIADLVIDSGHIKENNCRELLFRAVMRSRDAMKNMETLIEEIRRTAMYSCIGAGLASQNFRNDARRLRTEASQLQRHIKKGEKAAQTPY